MSETIEKRKFNKKTYRSIIFRVRFNSELDKLLHHHSLHGSFSVNFLITRALCNYFDCPLPHRSYKSWSRYNIFSKEENS